MESRRCARCWDTRTPGQSDNRTLGQEDSALILLRVRAGAHTLFFCCCCCLLRLIKIRRNMFYPKKVCNAKCKFTYHKLLPTRPKKHESESYRNYLYIFVYVYTYMHIPCIYIHFAYMWNWHLDSINFNLFA